MKKFTILAMFVAMVLSVSAQYKMRVWVDGGSVVYPVALVDSVTFEVEDLPDDPNTPVEPEKPDSESMITVKAKVPSDWTDVITVWVWYDGEPGREEPTTKEGDWYVYQQEGSELNIIFKNGFGWQGSYYQTADITGLEPGETYCYLLPEGAYLCVPNLVDCEDTSDSSPNVHKYVDLGLSVKWATCNVGANKPEEYGDCFAWGETQPKSTYDWSTYKWCNGTSDTQTKYCTDSDYGYEDNETTLDLSDDAARANWGGSWRMPTPEEQNELRTQCTWTWTTQNGVYGYKVTSNKFGYTNQSIFLPAAGYRSGNSRNAARSNGYYWSSSLSTDYPYDAYGLDFSYQYVSRSSDSNRYIGFSVRPVCQ